MSENKIQINWFPGHMAKAFRSMEKEINLIDVVIYVLDSRAPFSCVNPKYTTLIGNKPVVFVFNKYDIGKKSIIEDWMKYFKKDNSVCIPMNSTATGTGKKIENAIRELSAEKIEKYRLKNMNCTLRAMVIGVPNSGKSTLINNLCGKAKTVTGDKPGVTKGKQWVKIASGIELLDMPGTLWPSFDNNIIARHLAYIGSIREEVLDIPELAMAFISDIRMLDKTILENRYGITISDDSDLEVLEKICEARKFVVRGGEYDYDRGCATIITDFKQGRMGAITLESVSDVKLLMKKDKKEK